MKKLSTPVELIKKSIQIFSKKENAIFLVKIYLPVAILSFVLALEAYVPESFVLDNSIWFVLFSVLIQLALAFIGVYASIATVIAIKKIIGGQSLSKIKMRGLVGPIYWKYCLYSLAVFLVYFAGFALFVIPGIIFVVWYIFSQFIFIEEGLGIKASLAKSKDLVKGIFWKIVGRGIVFGIFAIAVQLIFAIIPYGIGVFITSILSGFFILPLYLLYKEVSE